MISQNNPNGWQIVGENENTYTIESNRSIYFLSDDWIESLIEIDPELFISESGIDDPELVNNISYVLIEDPVINRETLYEKLLEILKEVMKQSGGRRRLRKSRKSRKSKKSRKSRKSRK